jgi:hypothetical protein
VTFNQWAGGKVFETSERSAFEAVWNALPANEAPQLLTDLHSCWIEAIEAERVYYRDGEDD